MSKIKTTSTVEIRNGEKPFSIEFPESRMRHCHNVGLKMYYYAKERQGASEELARDMYLLGMLHDIGYGFHPDAFLHEEYMCKTLNSSTDGNYKYTKEILFHSKYQAEYDSPAMRLLYFADATVDAMGNWVTYEERLSDLETRYGIESEVYIESKLIADKCIEWGLDDKFVPKEVSTNFEKVDEQAVFRGEEKHVPKSIEEFNEIGID